MNHAKTGRRLKQTAPIFVSYRREAICNRVTLECSFLEHSLLQKFITRPLAQLRLIETAKPSIGVKEYQPSKLGDSDNGLARLVPARYLSLVSICVRFEEQATNWASPLAVSRPR